ncbi:MAG: hypothetical protein AAGA03_14545, partial [Planctomycetota bacterium]
MKRLGVQIAAGAVTILIGALAAAQAQKDHTPDSQVAWTASTAPASEPPTPIQAVASADWSASKVDSGSSDSVDGAGLTPLPSFPAGPGVGMLPSTQRNAAADRAITGAVVQAQYEEPIGMRAPAEVASSETPATSLGLPSIPVELPSSSSPSLQISDGSLTLPGADGSVGAGPAMPDAASKFPAAGNSLPEMTMESAPAIQLLGPPSMVSSGDSLDNAATATRFGVPGPSANNIASGSNSLRAGQPEITGGGASF